MNIINLVFIFFSEFIMNLSYLFDPNPADLMANTEGCIIYYISRQKDASRSILGLSVDFYNVKSALEIIRIVLFIECSPLKKLVCFYDLKELPESL